MNIFKTSVLLVVVLFMWIISDERDFNPDDEDNSFID